nr:integrase, catalytic region, zinc finger, CCHC-type, peptidase aspartic, catalytic [Tanacetum cinerariifolium]
MQINLALIAKYFKKIYKPTNNYLRTSSNSKNKNVDTTQRFKNDGQSGQFGTQRMVNVAGPKENVGKVNEQELEAHYSYMAKIQEVPTADSSTDSEPVEHHVALANLIANLKLDVDENKKIQKQLKKANTSLAQELKECKAILAETSKSLRESISVRDSCLVALQTKQTEFEKPQFKSNQSRDKVLLNTSQVKAKKTLVEVHPRIPSVSNIMKSVTACKDSLNSRTLNANAVCASCNKRLIDSNHFACVTKMLNDVQARTKKPNVVPISPREPKSQENKSIATPNKKKVASKSTNQKPQSYFRIVQLILFIVDSGCTKHMTGNLKLLCNFVENFLGTVRFGNDQFAPILGYGDLVQGNVTINRVYYVKA